jgi:hypothetical protein
MAKEDLEFTISAKDKASPVFSKVASNADKSLSQLEKKATQTSTRAGEKAATGFKSSFGGGLSKFNLVDAKFFGAAAIGTGIKFAIDAASNLQESLSKTDAVFKHNADEVKRWADTAASAFGQSKQQALEAAGTFGNLFQAFGVGLEPATEMSQTLTELASDLASFNNTSVQDAIEALRSGLSGETEPLKRYGVALTDARLKQEALGLGLIKDVKAPLDAAAKSQAAYSLIMKDTALAQGDFERTADGFANSMRTLQGTVTDAAAKIGEGLLPEIAKLAKYAKTGIDIAIRLTTPEAKLTGQEDIDNILRTVWDTANRTLNPLKAIEHAWDVSQDISGGMSEEEKKAAAATREHEAAMGALSRQYASARGGVAGYSQQMLVARLAADSQTNAMNLAHGGWVRGTSVIQEHNDALQRNIDLTLAAVDANFAVTAAHNNFLTANQAATAAVDDSTTAVNEQQVAFDAATQSAIAEAAAVVELDRQQQELAGGAQSAKEKQDLLIGTLMKLASQSAPAVAKSIGDVITKLQTMGAQNPRPTLGVNDQATGTMQAVDRRLRELDGRRATLTLDAIFRGGAAMSEANRFLNLANQARTVVRRDGGPIPGQAGAPVPVLAHGGEYVLSADVVDRIKRGDTSRGADTAALTLGSGRAGVAPSIAVNFNGGTFLGTRAEFGRLAQEAIAEAQRRGYWAA